MSQISWGKHALIFFALVVNLWVGGDLVELWLGRGARGVFEIILILGYLTLIVGMRTPMPWSRRQGEDAGTVDRTAPPPETGSDRDHEPWRSL